MRIASATDLGAYVRDRRRDLHRTQADLAVAARVSRRWLCDLEAGKVTAQFGLVLRVLAELDLMLEVAPVARQSDIDLDQLLHDLTGSHD